MNRQQQPVPMTRRASLPAPRTTAPQELPGIEEDDRYYIQTQMPRSARRYRDTEGHEVIEQGGRRYIMHTEPPPAPKRAQRHWLVPAGLGMLVMILALMFVSWAGTAWQQQQLDATYGMPRTYQVNAVVGHGGDSEAHPSHFIFMNLNSKAMIIEIPGQDPSKTIIYTTNTILGENSNSIPVTGEFRDVNGDGKPDMIVKDRDNALAKARAQLAEKKPIGLLPRPCTESQRQDGNALILAWSCQYVTYKAPPGAKVVSVQLSGDIVILKVRTVVIPR